MKHIRAGNHTGTGGDGPGTDNTVRTKIKYRKHRTETGKIRGEHLAGRCDSELNAQLV